MRIGLFFNSKLEASAAVASAIKSAEYRGRDVEFVEGDAGDDHGALDLAVSIGGDGTFLLTSKTIMGRGFPLYGINTGHLGFLASGDAQSAVRDMRKILECDCSTFPRIPLKGEIVRDGRCVQCVWALNEIMVVKSFVSKPIALSVHMGNGKLYSIQADGIIAATPTGSTAYALSAGGPIVHPGVRCAVVIPVCPHSLYPRPLVIPDTEALRIKLESPACGALLSGDGQDNMDLAPGDEVVVTSDTEKKIDVVSLGDETYADVLRGKLNWS